MTIQFNNSTDTITATGGTGSLSGFSISAASASGAIYENSQTISANYTMTTNKNGISVGPITIDSGVTVTIPSGSNWVVV